MGTTENRGRFEVEQPKVGPKGESRPWGRSRTESLGGLKEEQPEVGPKGAASGAMQVKDCREAAPKEEQVGKTCESNERERTSQMKIKRRAAHREPVLALCFQIPLQASLHGIVQTHRPLASRAALLGSRGLTLLE